MKRSAGFTLIELVIVIVILGILGAVAAPKLFNLQGDAYGANLNAMKSSIQTSMTMANAKAQIRGTGFGNGTADTEVDGYDGIEFINGYPKADSQNGIDSDPATFDGILGTLEEFDSARYAIKNTGTELLISPKTIYKADCRVTYTQAVKGEPAKGEPAKGDGTGTGNDNDKAINASPAKVKVETSGC